jgi:hypothetical protein
MVPFPSSPGPGDRPGGGGGGSGKSIVGHGRGGQTSEVTRRHKDPARARLGRRTGTAAHGFFFPCAAARSCGSGVKVPAFEVLTRWMTDSPSVSSEARPSDGESTVRPLD